MSKTKLDWVHQDHANVSEYRAGYKGLVIRAVHDDCPENPFEDQDGHWPMRVWYGRTWTAYDRGAGGYLNAPLDRFTDAQLVHDQIHIARAFKSTVADLIECYSVDIDHYNGEKYLPFSDLNAGLLRDAFSDALNDRTGSGLLDILAELYAILGVPCLRHTSRGYSQGDEAELLIVATPEAMTEFGASFETFLLEARADPEIKNHITDHERWAWDKACKIMLEPQAKLYDAWAWRDVYGYVVCRPGPVPILDEYGKITNTHEFAPGCLPDPDDYEPELEELTSCWGYYGSDFGESGLEDAAIEACHNLDDDQMTPELLAAQTKGAW